MVRQGNQRGDSGHTRIVACWTMAIPGAHNHWLPQALLAEEATVELRAGLLGAPGGEGEGDDQIVLTAGFAKRTARCSGGRRHSKAWSSLMSRSSWGAAGLAHLLEQLSLISYRSVVRFSPSSDR